MIIGILGCGYVGKAVAIALKNEGHIVYVSTRKPERHPELETFANKVFTITDDLTSFIKDIEILFVSVAPDSPSVDEYTLAYLKTAQNIAFNILQAKQLKQIIYIGTTSVYQESNGGWVDETAPVNETDEKSKILIQTENILSNLASKTLNVCIFRLGEISGPGREIKQRLFKMAGQPFPGDGSQFTNLITLEDIIKATFFALKKELNGVFNLCNELHIPRKELYEKICQKEALHSVQWDPALKNSHGGKKKISSAKLEKLDFKFSSQHFF